MLHKERHKPVRDIVEEGETLGLRKTAVEDVGTLALHVHHALKRLFQFFHTLLRGIRMQHVFQGIVLHLLDTILGHAEALVIHDIWHNFLLYGIGILLSIHRVNHLDLKLSQLSTDALRFQQFLNQCALLRIDSQHIVVYAQHPAHQCTLAYMFFCRTTIHTHQRTEFHNVETIHQRQHYSRYQQLLVVGIYGGRSQQFLHHVTCPLRPDIRCQQIVEQLVHLLLMNFVKRLTFFLSSMFWLQLKQSRLTHKVLHFLTNNFQIHGASRLTGIAM